MHPISPNSAMPGSTPGPIVTTWTVNPLPFYVNLACGTSLIAYAIHSKLRASCNLVLMTLPLARH